MVIVHFLTSLFGVGSGNIEEGKTSALKSSSELDTGPAGAGH